MRQKYQIARNGAEALLSIRELAVIDNHLDGVDSSTLGDASFCLLCEETYHDDVIATAIAVGMAELITTLRTPSFFPNHRCANRIAEAVVALYASGGCGGIDLLVDD
jgi:hypothetical protein